MGVGVLVVGSINVDTTNYVPRLPAPGETVAARSSRVALGGKGANQAVAAARFGARVRFVAAVGDDSAGAFALDELRRFGLDVGAVRVVPGVPTGAAAITVDDAGENTVVVVAGANAEVGPDAAAGSGTPVRPAPGAADASSGPGGSARVVLAQGELAAGVVDALAAAAAGAAAAGDRFVLNLAPPIPVRPETLAAADPLIVNELEARAIGIDFGGSAEDPDARIAAARAAAAAAVRAGRCRSLVVTLGAAGAVAAESDGRGGMRDSHHPALRVRAVDTTGAGDCFAGTLAAALSEGRSLQEAVRFAVVASACSVESPGTVDSYADRAAVLTRAARADPETDLDTAAGAAAD